MSPNSNPGAPLQSPRSLPWRDAWIVFSLLAAATFVCFVLAQHVSLTSEAMVYVLGVVIASYTVSRTAAVLSAVGAVALLNFFFVQPRYTLQVDAKENLAALAAMLAVAIVISHLAAISRRETEAARLNARRARELQELASELAGCSHPSEVYVLAQTFLAHAFPGSVVVALLTPSGGLTLSEEHSALQDGMFACIREGTTLGSGTGRWPRLNAWYVPLKSERHIGGAACIQNASTQDQGGLEHAQVICALAGQALWRIKLAASVHAAEEQSQWHKAQNTFLAAVSHDFRTPLASIVAAASSLETQRDKLTAHEQASLISSILEEARHLATMTENTLQLARLENAGELNLDWQSVEEIVGAVLGRVRGRDPTRRIRSHVPSQLPLIRADPVLLAQLLENLLDNALKYSTDAIDLTTNQVNGYLEISVQDRGDPMTAEEERSIFEPYRRSDRSGKRGTGLGLALCRAIARSHGGELTRTARESGGSSFVLRLPVEQTQPAPEPA